MRTTLISKRRKIKSPEEFDLLVDLYVLESIEHKDPLTITGLTLYLGFAAVDSLYDYGKRAGFEGYARAVKRARLIVQNGYEKTVARGGQCAGSIFLLKASYGYNDKSGETVVPITINFEGKFKNV